MKTIFTFLVTMILSITLYAFPGQSKLSITATSNASIRVMVDGEKYAANNNSVLVNDLEQGYHSIKVYQLKHGDRKNVRGYYQLLYDGRLYVKPRYHVDITINRFGKAFVDEERIGEGYYNNEDDEADYWNNNNGSGNIHRAMNKQSFDQFKQTLRNESFDNTRLTIAKQVISDNFFTTAQVKEIAQAFTYESNKLDIAKYAYEYVIDKQNYFIMNDVFTYSSSKEELVRSIQGK